MKTYIIHYTPLKDRKISLEEQFNFNNIKNYEFIEDYDKDVFTPVILDHYYEYNPNKFYEKVHNLWDSNIHRPRQLNMSEISSSIKHLEAMKKIAESGEEYGLILEDDAILLDDFNKKLQLYIEDTPSDWDAIFLGEGCGLDFQINKLRSSTRSSNFSYLMPHPATNTVDAYIIKSTVARRAYDEIIPFQLVIDWDLAYNLYKNKNIVYWWYPSLVTQGSKNGKYESELDSGQR